MLKPKKKKKRDLDFLFEIGSLKNFQRSWRQTLGVQVATNLEHTVRVAFLALIIARREGVQNEEKILKMALAHDLAESRTGDGNYTHKVYVKEDEDRAMNDLFAETVFGDFVSDILKEYKERKSLEAKIVKDADNLDVDLELKELEERGHALPRKWRVFRRLVRDKKLYTASAKSLWDDIQKANVSRWHMESNKWLKVKHAGK